MNSPVIHRKDVRRVVEETKRDLAGKVVGVVSGGRSLEREASQYTARFICEALTLHDIQYVEIDPSAPSFIEAARKVDVCFNALHGAYGEDGKLQGFLETTGTPYTGSGVMASALGMNKRAFKIFAKGLGVASPSSCFLPAGEEAILSFGFPFMLKPNSEGGSIGIKYIESAEDWQIARKELGRSVNRYFLEEFIPGRLVTASMLQFEGRRYELPLVEIKVVGSKKFYDKESKYETGFVETTTAVSLPPSVRTKISRGCRKLFDSSACSDYARFDVITDESCAFFLEMNTLPGLYPSSNFQEAADAIDISLAELVLIFLSNALSRSDYRP